MKLLKRYVFFIFGVFLTALGISFITKSGLGTSAIASPSFVLSQILAYKFGLMTSLISFVMILLQILILKKEFNWIQLLQFPSGLLMGILIDIYMFMLVKINLLNYYAQVICLLFGVMILGLGVAMQVIGNVLMLPAEGLVRAISYKTGIIFGKTKVLFDVFLVIISLLLSFIYLGKIVGIREGTVITAIATGYFARFFQTIITKKLKIKF